MAQDPSGNINIKKYVQSQTAGGSGEAPTSPQPLVLSVNGQTGEVEIDAASLDAPTVTQSRFGPVLLGPNGYPLNSPLKASQLTIMPINVSAFGTISQNNSFNQRFGHKWIRGRVGVQLLLRNGSTTTPQVISRCIVGGGADISLENPTFADGSLAPWTAFANDSLVCPVSDAAWVTNGLVGSAISPMQYVNIPPGGEGGVYVRSVSIGANLSGYVGNASRPVNAYETVINGMVPGMRYFGSYEPGNFVSVNPNLYVGPNKQSQFMPIVGVKFTLPNRKLLTFDQVGDSTSEQLAAGTAPNNVPFNFSWLLEVVNRRINAGLPMGLANWAFEGRPASHFLGRYLQMLQADISQAGALAVLQIFSINAPGFTDATIDANIALAQQITDIRTAAGLETIWRTTFPVQGLTAPEIAAWTRGNNLIRNSGNVVFDAAAVPIVTPDGRHLDLASTYAVADALDLLLISLGI